MKRFINAYRKINGTIYKTVTLSNESNDEASQILEEAGFFGEYLNFGQFNDHPVYSNRKNKINLAG